MEVLVTDIFVKNYRRYNNRAAVHNTLRDLRNRIQASPNWIRDYEQTTTAAVRPTFRAKLSKGDRMLINHRPPLCLLDLGEHDQTYDRWNKGKTKSSVQLQRASSIALTPGWVTEIFIVPESPK
mgnify:CR=1 FL=1